MRILSALLIAVAGVINLVPIVGVLSVSRLAGLYDVAIEGPDLEVLMRHRAVVLGTTGLLLLAAAIRPSLRPVAAFVGLASMLSFILVAWTVGGYNAQLSRVLTADWIGVAALCAGMLISYYDARNPSATE